MKLQEVSIGSKLYEAVLELRYHLFFEELGLPKSVVPDALEDASTHLTLSDNGLLVGLYKKLGFVPIGEVYTVELTGVAHRKMVYHANTF